MDNFQFVVILIIGLGGWSQSLPKNDALLGPQDTIPIGTFGLDVNATGNRTETKFSDNADVYIVGGVPATPHEFPWLVNLRIDRSFCGGSIIASDYVLTAAHCVVTQAGGPVSPNQITVYAGDHLLNVTESSEQIVRASEVNVHRDYNPSNFKNDIALIKLSRNLTWTKEVSPIAYQNVTNTSTTGTVAGWGTLSDGGTTVSNVLQKVEVPIITGQICNSQMTNPAGQFCAGTSGKDSCQGDSGGPFICSNNRNAICGIVSYGEGCALPNKPGVYTRVSSYVNWINERGSGTGGGSGGGGGNSGTNLVNLSASVLMMLAVVTLSISY